MRINDSHQDAQQQKNTLGNGLEVSAEAREAFIPRVFGSGVSRRAGSKTGALSMESKYRAANSGIGSLGLGNRPVDDADFEKLMQDMEKGLAGMTTSVDQLQAKLAASPRVHELAVHEPKVVQLLTDRDLQQGQLRIMRDMQHVLHEFNTAMRQPKAREQLLAHAQLLQSRVAEVVQDLDAPKRRVFAPAMSLRAPIKTPTRAAPQMVVGEVERQRTYDLYGTYPGEQGKLASGIAIKKGDIGTTFPLGIYDPLNLIKGDAPKYRRWQEMEIKHGRLAMAATLHVLITEAGFRFPGYLSDGTFGGDPIKFADMPGGTWASWAAMPALGWAQIIAFIALCDSAALQDGLRGGGVKWLPEKLFAQDPKRAPGDVASLDPNWWKRYDDPKEREFKLNAERNNGRAAMMGIIGMMIHEALTGNPLFPLPAEPVTSIDGAWWEAR